MPIEFQTVDAAPAGGSPSASGGGGPPKWLLYGAAVAGVLGLVVLLKRKGAGGGSNSSPAPTQTQESLAVGDLAYQVQNGLGGLGVQAAKNQDALAAQVNATTNDLRNSLGQQSAQLNSLQAGQQTQYSSSYSQLNYLVDYLNNLRQTLGQQGSQLNSLGGTPRTG